MKIRIKLENKMLTANLDDNATVRDFVYLLPVTLTLRNFAVAEKMSELPRKLSIEGAPAGYDPNVKSKTSLTMAVGNSLAIFLQGPQRRGRANQTRKYRWRRRSSEYIRPGKSDNRASSITTPKQGAKMTTNKNESYTGKVAFVTGAANGIGRATALAFAREDASVVIADVSEQNNQETARMIEELGGRALAVKCDVSRAADVKAALDKAVETFGRLDFAFNNAGIEQPITAVADLTEEEWDRIMRINLRGVFLCMKYEIALMLKQGGGAIVNTSSGAGVKGFKGQAAYAAAKHGVIGLTKSAALDYAQSIRINAVCPGIIATPMMQRFTGGTHEGEQRVIAQEPVGRMGTPEEIAAAVVWLCSDSAAFVIGHAMVIDGGQTV
jgi:NAD(P)-dependent dehydrogenase (short-subunit alcohol dehydrogenase family)